MHGRARKRPEPSHVLGVALVDERCFQDHRLRAQLRVVQDSGEGVRADLAVADGLVAVAVGPQGRLGVVGVDQAYVIHSEALMHFVNGFAQSRFCGHVVTRCEAMRGVNAESERNVAPGLHGLPQVVEFLEAASQRRSASRGVLEQQAQ